MLTFIATTHRYTADFCPALFLGSAVGLAFLDQQTGWWRRGTLAAAAGLIALSCVIQLGISFHFRVEGVWGVPEELRNHFLETRAVFDRWFPGTPP